MSQYVLVERPRNSCCGCLVLAFIVGVLIMVLIGLGLMDLADPQPTGRTVTTAPVAVIAEVDA